MSSSRFIASRSDFPISEDIAAKAGIGKGTVYLYFKNKDDIVLNIALDYLNNALKNTKSKLDQIDDVEDQLREMVKYYPVKTYEFVNEYKHADDFLHYLEYANIEKLGYANIVENYYAYFRMILNAGIERNIFKINDIEERIKDICFMINAFLPPYREVSSIQELNLKLDNYVDMLLDYCKKQ